MDLPSGQYSSLVRVVAFTTAERWSEDVSDDVLRKFATVRSPDARAPRLDF
jgi:hypothetical protein